MSTSINNAYRLNTSNAKKVKIINQKLRELMKLAQVNYMKRRIMNEASIYFFYKLPFVVSGYKEEDKKENSSLNHFLIGSEYNDIDILKFIVDEMSKNKDKMYITEAMFSCFQKCSDMSISNTYNLNMDIYFIGHGNKTIYIISGKSDIRNEFFELLASSDIKDELTDYSYWNNTDRPDEVSAREWNSREKTWDEIFEGTNYMRDSMNTISVYLNYADSVHIQRRALFDYVPNEHFQFHYIFKEQYKRKLYKQYADEDKKNLQKDNDNEEFGKISSCYFKASDDTMALIESGEYLKFYDEYKDYLYSQDELYDLITKTKLSFEKTSDED